MAVPRVHSPRDRDRDRDLHRERDRDASFPAQHSSSSAHFMPQFTTHFRRRRASSTASPPARPGFADRTSFMSTDTYDEFEEGVHRRGQEQMSPVTVVLYVVFFYIVWQILTRSDDHEILSHLPSSSPLHGPHALDPRPATANSPSTPYGHLPYALPQLAPPPSSTEPTSTWRTVLHAIVYPIYLGVTLLAIPLPFLVNALNLLASILSTILYPVTSTARLLARTFILAPLSVVLSFLHALYPVYVFVGGVVGVGAFLGVAVGWLGRALMWLLLGRRSAPAAAKKRKRRSSKRHSAPVNFDYDEYRHHSHGHHSEREHHRDVPPPAPRSPSYEYERRYVPIDYAQILDDMARDARAAASGRDAVVLGLRRRGVRH